MPPGPDLPVKAFPWWLLYLSAPVYDLSRQVLEMRYLWQRPFALDDPSSFRSLAQSRTRPLTKPSSSHCAVSAVCPILGLTVARLRNGSPLRDRLQDLPCRRPSTSPRQVSRPFDKHPGANAEVVGNLTRIESACRTYSAPLLVKWLWSAGMDFTATA